MPLAANAPGVDFVPRFEAWLQGMISPKEVSKNLS